MNIQDVDQHYVLSWTKRRIDHSSANPSASPRFKNHQRKIIRANKNSRYPLGTTAALWYLAKPCFELFQVLSDQLFATAGRDRERRDSQTLIEKADLILFGQSRFVLVLRVSSIDQIDDPL